MNRFVVTAAMSIATLALIVGVALRADAHQVEFAASCDGVRAHPTGFPDQAQNAMSIVVTYAARSTTVNVVWDGSETVRDISLDARAGGEITIDARWAAHGEAFGRAVVLGVVPCVATTTTTTTTSVPTTSTAAPTTSTTAPTTQPTSVSPGATPTSEAPVSTSPESVATLLPLKSLAAQEESTTSTPVGETSTTPSLIAPQTAVLSRTGPSPWLPLVVGAAGLAMLGALLLLIRHLFDWSLRR